MTLTVFLCHSSDVMRVWGTWASFRLFRCTFSNEGKMENSETPVLRQDTKSHHPPGCQVLQAGAKVGLLRYVSWVWGSLRWELPQVQINIVFVKSFKHQNQCEKVCKEQNTNIINKDGIAVFLGIEIWPNVSYFLTALKGLPDFPLKEAKAIL